MTDSTDSYGWLGPHPVRIRLLALHVDGVITDGTVLLPASDD
jgi:3-deoxy-D-manno-octulosonate 8-phosphate phosphatase KdsC-like HAD superfamily phosphatase